MICPVLRHLEFLLAYRAQCMSHCWLPRKQVRVAELRSSVCAGHPAAPAALPCGCSSDQKLIFGSLARPAPRYQTQKNINKCFLYVSLVVIPLLLPALTFHFLQSQASPFFFWCVCAGVATPHAAVGNDPGASLHDCQEGHQLLEFFFPTF